MKKVKLRKRTRGKLYYEYGDFTPVKYYSNTMRVKVNENQFNGLIGHFGSFRMVSLDDIEGYKNK